MSRAIPFVAFSIGLLVEAAGVHAASPSVTVLEARVDTLRCEGRFADALSLARDIERLRRTDKRSKPYQVEDSRRRVRTLENVLLRTEEERAALAEAWCTDLDVRAALARGEYESLDAAASQVLDQFERNLGPNRWPLDKTLAYMDAARRGRVTDMARDEVVRKALPGLPGGANSSEASRAFVLERLLRAEETFARALGVDDPQVASGLSTIAGVYISEFRFAAAESVLTRAVEINTVSRGVDHPEVARALKNLGQVYRMQQRLPEAERCFARALEIEQKQLGPAHPEVANDLVWLARVHLEQGKDGQVERLLRRALEIRGRVFGADARSCGEVMMDLAALYRRQARYPAADSCLYRAFVIERDEFRREAPVLAEVDALVRAKRVRALMSGYLGWREAANDVPGRAERVVDATLSCKGLVSDGRYDLHRFVREDTSTATRKAWDALVSAKRTRSAMFVRGVEADPEIFRAQLDSLRRVEHALETKLAALSAAYRGYLATGNVSASTLSHLVPGNAAAVEFVRFEKDVHSSKGVTAYLAVVLRAGVRPTVVDLGDGGPIDTAVQRYRELVDLPPSRMEDTHELDQYRAAARQLSASVWAPLVPLLDDAHLVIVAPDGSLNLVAFGTLVSEPGHYLIEEKTIHYVSALRDLVRFEQDYSPGVGLLAMGNPDFDVLSPERSVKPKAAAVEMVSRGDEREARPRCRDFAQRNWPALPATASEVRAVTAGWRQSVKEPANLLLGMQASEGRFKADAPSSRVVYFATHGYFLTDCADDLNGAIDAPLLRSGVLLAGANRHGKNAEEDGVVTAHEIATLDMEAVEAVVLSGCETGLGTVQDGEGVYGLRRAFLMAGARHVVSALWRVPDLATAVMMAGLYESNTLSLGARIRAAQLERLASLRQLGQSDHPAQWGAFIVVGDPR